MNNPDLSRLFCQRVQAARFSLTEFVLYMEDGSQVIVEPEVINADAKKGNPYGIVRVRVIP